MSDLLNSSHVSHTVKNIGIVTPMNECPRYYEMPRILKHRSYRHPRAYPGTPIRRYVCPARFPPRGIIDPVDGCCCHALPRFFENMLPGGLREYLQAGTSQNFRRRFTPHRNAGGALRNFPRVENPNAEECEVLHVACNQRKIVLEGGSGDEPVRCVEADAFQLAVSFQNAPAF